MVVKSTSVLPVPARFPALDLPDTLGAAFLPRLAATVALVLAVVFGVRLLRRLLARMTADRARLYAGYKVIGRLAGAGLAAALVLVWAPVGRNLLTVFTVVGAGLLLATREAVLSVFGWLHLVLRAPYRQGDRIEINGVRGDVVDIRLLHTTVVEVGGWVADEQSTGRLVHIPNQWVFLYPVTNGSVGAGFVWNELSVTVTPGSDWRRVKETLEGLAAASAAESAARVRASMDALATEYLVDYTVLTPFVYVHLGEKGVRLTLRYLCEVRQRRVTAHALTVALLDALDGAADVTFATS